MNKNLVACLYILFLSTIFLFVGMSVIYTSNVVGICIYYIISGLCFIVSLTGVIYNARIELRRNLERNEIERCQIERDETQTRKYEIIRPYENLYPNRDRSFDIASQNYPQYQNPPLYQSGKSYAIDIYPIETNSKTPMVYRPSAPYM